MTTMSASEIELVTLNDIESAARGLAGVAVRTPLLPFDALAERVGAPVFVKPEMLQRGGAFKFRGAYTYLSRLSAAERERGVIAPSSGNHAQAVALAAKLFGVPATVVMPTTVTRGAARGTRHPRRNDDQRSLRESSRDRSHRRRYAGAAVRSSEHHCRAGHARPRDRERRA